MAARHTTKQTPRSAYTVPLSVNLNPETLKQLRTWAIGPQVGRIIEKLVLAEQVRREERARMQRELAAAGETKDAKRA
jgi:hypothetical protein